MANHVMVRILARRKRYKQPNINYHPTYYKIVKSALNFQTTLPELQGTGGNGSDNPEESVQEKVENSRKMPDDVW